MKSLKKNITLIFLVFLMFCVGFGTITGYRYFFSENVIPDKGKGYAYIHIPNGASFQEVLDSLEGKLKNRSMFDSYATWRGYNENVKPGRYKLESGWSNLRIVRLLMSGKQEVVKLTFNNQQSLESVARRVSSQIEASEQEIIDAFLSTEFLEEKKLTSETVRGILVPNTYHFYWNSSAESFRDRMYTEYEKFWSPRLTKAQKLNMSPMEISTLASIVQKETAKRNEMPVVAGLYVNRLKKSMPLQADPTIIYVIRQEMECDTCVIRRVVFSDLQIPSPYNTYINKGLPPGPICVPEIVAIDAVLNYQKHSFVYMCASVDRIGYHEFAVSYTEHEENRRKYRAWLDKQNIKR